MDEWKCSVCGYVHDDEEPPDQCPICAAPASKFVKDFGDEPEVSNRPDKHDDDEFYGAFDEP